MPANDPNQDQPYSPDQTESPQCPICSCTGRWRWFIIAAIVVLIIAVFTNRFGPQSELASSAINWSHDYQAALQQAKEQNKPLLIAFHASWCPPCRQMKKTTYQNTDVAKTLKAFVPVMIDSDIQTDLTSKYNVKSLPTYIILLPGGTIFNSFTGFHSSEDFIAKLKPILSRS